MNRLSTADHPVNNEESESKVEYSRGARAIGRVIGRTPRQAYHFLIAASSNQQSRSARLRRSHRHPASRVRR